MGKAEEFVKDCTRNCSNVFINPRLDGTEENHPWITPDQALTAIEIAREEMAERAIKWVEYNNENGGCKFDGWIEDLKQAMKDG
jgi:hypothetical protein